MKRAEQQQHLLEFRLQRIMVLGRQQNITAEQDNLKRQILDNPIQLFGYLIQRNISHWISGILNIGYSYSNIRHTKHDRIANIGSPIHYPK